MASMESEATLDNEVPKKSSPWVVWEYFGFETMSSKRFCARHVVEQLPPQLCDGCMAKKSSESNGA